MKVAERDRRVDGVVDALRAAGVGEPAVGVVLGSGLGGFVERLAARVEVPFDALDGLPVSGVPGHAGRFDAGDLGGVRVLAQAGRVHRYEGWDAEEVALAVRAMVRLGCCAVVLTNAAGGLREGWPPGTLMRIVDHLNLQGASPLAPSERGRGTPWDAKLGRALDEAAGAAGVRLEAGVYAALLGPSYETPAEVRALGRFGADAVGMSTAAEALAAHAEGARVVGVSCITNLAAGLSPEPLAHEEVLEVGRRAAADFEALLAAAVPELAARV